MNIFENFLRWLVTPCEQPKPFSLVHLIGLGVMILIIVLLCIFSNKISKKVSKYILLGLWIALIIVEVGKELALSTKLDTQNNVSFTYNWIAFPFQFCSTPFYLLPLIIFLKDGIFKRRLELFSALSFLIGGIIGVFVPSFSPYVFLNFQTLFHHEVMIIVAFLITINIKDEFKLIYFFQCLPNFVVLVTIALALNGIVPACVPQSLNDGFNMFFISWHNAPGLPVLKDVWNAVPYPVFLLLYLIGFSVLMFIMYVLFSLLFTRKIDFSLKTKKENVSTIIQDIKNDNIVDEQKKVNKNQIKIKEKTVEQKAESTMGNEPKKEEIKTLVNENHVKKSGHVKTLKTTPNKKNSMKKAIKKDNVKNTKNKPVTKKKISK